MDSPKSNEQGAGATKASIDSLRTVEFRTTIRGYHMDDVDEYLERVAVEAEAIQEQMRLAQDRVKQATERVSSLEQQLEQARRVQQAHQQERQQEKESASPAGVADELAADDTLQRTLLLAQRFVDQTKEEAETEARTLISESEARARVIVADAEEHARVVAENAERNLREEVQRLESNRGDLSRELEAITRQLESERARIREVLTEMLAFVDKRIQPQRPVSASSPPGSSSPSRPGQEDKPKDLQGTGFGMTGVPDQRSRDGAASVARGEPVSRAETAASAEPTERIPATSLLGEEDDYEDGAATGSVREAGRGARERLLPGQQREMFAPGLQSNQTETRAAR
jgi:cell division initiation protein